MMTQRFLQRLINPFRKTEDATERVFSISLPGVAGNPDTPGGLGIGTHRIPSPWRPLPLLSAVCCLLSAPASAQMVTGRDMPGFADVFDLKPAQQAKGWEVREIAIKTPTGENANVLWPGEKASFTFRFTNKTDTPITARG